MGGAIRGEAAAAPSNMIVMNSAAGRAPRRVGGAFLASPSEPFLPMVAAPDPKPPG